VIDLLLSPENHRWMLDWQDRPARNIRRNVGQVHATARWYWQYGKGPW